MNQTELKELLWYDKVSGLFLWRNAKKYNAIAPWSKAGWSDGGYIRIQIGKKGYLAHRLAWLYEHGVWPEKDVDHINGNRCDNRIENLRDVSRKINTQNRRCAGINSTTGVLGVSRHRDTDKWISGIYINGKRIHLGVFETIEEAEKAYVQAKRQSHEGCTI